MRLEEKKLNILQVHNYYQIRGGEDTVAENEKTLLESRGHHVFVYKRNNAELNQLSILGKLMLPFTAIFSRKSYREIRRTIQDNQIDIVHVHNTLMMVSPSVFYAAAKEHIPVVQTMHNFRMLCPAGSFFRDGQVCEACGNGQLIPAMRYRCYRNSLMQTFVSAAILYIHRALRTYKNVYFLCLTSFNREKLLQLNQKRTVVDPQKIYLKPNFAFDVPQVKKEPEYYLWIGRLEPLKGIMTAISAFEKMSDKKLLVIGDGPLKEEVCAYIKEQGITNITLEGFVEKDKLQEYYAKAKALIVSSQCYETFGLVIAEAFASSIPAIVGDIGNIGAMVESGVNGLKYTYDSSDALVEAVRQFEAYNWETLSLNARRTYEKRFRPESNARLLEQIYNQIIEDYTKK